MGKRAAAVIFLILFYTFFRPNSYNIRWISSLNLQKKVDQNMMLANVIDVVFFCTLFAHIICSRYNLGGCQCRCSFCYHKEHVRYDSREILALIMNGIANLCGFEMCAQLYITTNEVHIFYYKPSTKWLVKFFSNFSKNLVGNSW